MEFTASEMATDATRIDGTHVAAVRVKRKRHYLPPRIDHRNRIGRRITELEATFKASLGDRELTPLLAHLIRQAAELTAMAEEGRARFLRGEHCQLDDVVRAERRARARLRRCAFEMRRRARRRPSLSTSRVRCNGAPRREAPEDHHHARGSGEPRLFRNAACRR